MGKIYFEDLRVGETRSFGSYTVDREEIVDFAETFDPQPFHLDEDAAADSHFGDIVASGMHTLALSMRLAVEEFYVDSAVIAGKGIDNLRWTAPVYPRDTLTVESEVLAKTKRSQDADRGDVTSRRTMANQDGQTVLDLEVTAVFGCRNATDG